MQIKSGDERNFRKYLTSLAWSLMLELGMKINFEISVTIRWTAISPKLVISIIVILPNRKFWGMGMLVKRIGITEGCYNVTFISLTYSTSMDVSESGSYVVAGIVRV